MSLVKGTTFVVMMLGLIFQSNWAQATTYTVGDSAGWAFGTAGWEIGKYFKAGDTLVFNYRANRHNVMVVNQTSFESCSIPANAQTYTSGKDEVKLVKGDNYFICGIFQGHCEAGMKIAAIAS